MLLKEATYNVYDMPMYNDAYSFNFVRQINNLELAENGVNISIDKNTLKIRNYNFMWDKGTFADPTKAIGLTPAKKIFSDKLGIQLSYNIINDSKTKTQSAILVYGLKNGSMPIDAITGELLKNGYYPMYGGMDMRAEKSAVMKNSALTPEEQKSVDTSSKYVSQENATAEAKNTCL